MGAIIAKAYEKVGETGSTVVEESRTSDEVEFTEGLGRPWISFTVLSERH